MIAAEAEKFEAYVYNSIRMKEINADQDLLGQVLDLVRAQARLMRFDISVQVVFDKLEYQNNILFVVRSRSVTYIE